MRYGDMPIGLCVLRGYMNVFVISTSQLDLMLDKRNTCACLWVPSHISANLAYMYSTEPYDRSLDQS